MDEATLRAVAKLLASGGSKMYRDGDCCPLCGYDAYWGCDTKEDSEAAVYARLVDLTVKAGEDAS